MTNDTSPKEKVESIITFGIIHKPIDAEVCEAIPRIKSKGYDQESFVVGARFVWYSQSVADIQRENQKLQNEIALKTALIEKCSQALNRINMEELNNQRPGGGYSVSAKLSYDALNYLNEKTGEK